MKGKPVLAGTQAEAGIYRCNACANEYEHESDGKVLPCCQVCDSSSWNAFKPACEKKKGSSLSEESK